MREATTDLGTDDQLESIPRGFAATGLVPALVSALEGFGYALPTPIQSAAIPAILAGSDVIGQAATGTGKTAAFALPLVQRIGAQSQPRKQPSALVLVPTRELALQVSQAIVRYGQPLGVRALPIYGGQSYEQQVRGLRRGTDIVIATPGRAQDLVRQGALDLGSISAVVLDEADEMLAMGFIDDIDAILALVPTERQVILFSATLPPRIANVSKRYMRDPQRICVRGTTSAPEDANGAPRIRQAAYLVGRAQKAQALVRLLELEEPTSAIVFCRTRSDVDGLSEALAKAGRSAAALHGGMSQVQRERVIAGLRGGRSELVVATDVAARGLDIDSLTHVFNFDVPSAPEQYVHRIGRVGRAGRDGVALTLAEPRDVRHLREIERTTRNRIDQGKVPTRQDLAARRLDRVRGVIAEALTEGGLDVLRPALDALTAEHDLVNVALAAIKVAAKALAGGSEADAAAGSADDIAPQQMRKAPRSDARGESRGDPRAAKGPMVRLHLGQGRAAGIEPRDLVGAITGEAGVSGRQIGAIDMSDRFAIIEVEVGVVDVVMDALRQAVIKGRKIPVRRFQEARAVGVPLGSAGRRDRDPRSAPRATRH